MYVYMMMISKRKDLEKKCIPIEELGNVVKDNLHLLLRPVRSTEIHQN